MGAMEIWLGWCLVPIDVEHRVGQSDVFKFTIKALMQGTRSGGGTKTKIDCGARALTCFLVISLQQRSRLGAARGRL